MKWQIKGRREKRQKQDQERNIKIPIKKKRNNIWRLGMENKKSMENKKETRTKN